LSILLNLSINAARSTRHDQPGSDPTEAQPLKNQLSGVLGERCCFDHALLRKRRIVVRVAYDWDRHKGASLEGGVDLLGEAYDLPVGVDSLRELKIQPCVVSVNDRIGIEP
jgi:hypothetical protein